MDPQTTALIMVGYQNDYFAQDGILRGVVEEPNRVDAVLANTLAFVQQAAATPMLIISTPIVLERDYRALASPVGILNAIKEAGAFKAGSTGAEAACSATGSALGRASTFSRSSTVPDSTMPAINPVASNNAIRETRLIMTLRRGADRLLEPSAP